MRFVLIDHVLECTDERVRAVKQVSLAEEYLQDHFPTFPILPGVFMLEVMVQAARHLLIARLGPDVAARMVLGSVRALKYGAMVKPGQSLLVDVEVGAANDDGSYDCRGSGQVLSQHHMEKLTDSPPDPAAGATAVSGRFTMRPMRID